MAKSQVPAVAEEETRNILALLRSGALDFATAVAEADEVIGSDLWSGAMLDALVGVPFIVLGGTYRSGFARTVEGKKYTGDYVSLEIVIADEATLKFRGINVATAPFKPLQVIRFNDGSTGVRRQMTQYLAAKGYITISDTPVAEITSGGGMGESEYDIPVSYWKDYVQGDYSTDDEGNGVYDFVLPRGLSCPRGLRTSDYKNEYGEGRTRYFG